MTPMTTWPLPTALALLGVAALMFGLRGRRVGDHPTCGRCGFDLYGLPPGAGRCSECGAVLRGRRAVRVGHRRRGWRLAVLGAVLALVGAGWLGRSGWSVVQANPNRFKPAGWLVRETEGADVAERDAALAELVYRTERGRLSARHLAVLTDRGLDYHGDPTLPWVPQWAQLIEAADAGGKLSADERERYWMQAVQPRISMRVDQTSVRRPGARHPLLFLTVRLSGIRVHDGGPYVMVRMPETVELDGRTLPAGAWDHRGSIWAVAGTMNQGWHGPLAPLNEVADGTHRLRFTVRFAAYAEDDIARCLASFPIEVESEFSVPAPLLPVRPGMPARRGPLPRSVEEDYFETLD